MRRLFLILRREYLAYLLTPGFLIALVVLPLVLAASAVHSAAGSARRTLEATSVAQVTCSRWRRAISASS